jgi:hypothetical protein
MILYQKINDISNVWTKTLEFAVFTQPFPHFLAREAEQL